MLFQMFDSNSTIVVLSKGWSSTIIAILVSLDLLDLKPHKIYIIWLYHNLQQTRLAFIVYKYCKYAITLYKNRDDNLVSGSNAFSYWVCYLTLHCQKYTKRNTVALNDISLKITGLSFGCRLNITVRMLIVTVVHD